MDGISEGFTVTTRRQLISFCEMAKNIGRLQEWKNKIGTFQNEDTLHNGTSVRMQG